MVHKY